MKSRLYYKAQSRKDYSSAMMICFTSSLYHFTKLQIVVGKISLTINITVK